MTPPNTPDRPNTPSGEGAPRLIPPEDVRVGDELVGRGRVTRIQPYEGRFHEYRGGFIVHTEREFGVMLPPGELVEVRRG